MIKPIINKMHLSDFIDFQNHNDFKTIRSSLKDTMEKIEKTKEKLAYKESINNQIQHLHAQLNNETCYQALEKELSTSKGESECLEFFKLVDIRNFTIEKIFYRALFGSLASESISGNQKYLNDLQKYTKEQEVH